MSSLTLKTTTPNSTLPALLQQIGLLALPANLDDFLARAAKARWSPHQILEQPAQAEVAERSHRSLERRKNTRTSPRERRAPPPCTTKPKPRGNASLRALPALSLCSWFSPRVPPRRRVSAVSAPLPCATQHTFLPQYPL